MPDVARYRLETDTRYAMALIRVLRILAPVLPARLALRLARLPQRLVFYRFNGGRWRRLVR